MPSKELAPLGKVKMLRLMLEEYAQKNGLFLNPKFEWKIGWMEEHQGRCFCDWEKRFCPCEHALGDLKRFNGICLCGVLCMKQKLLYYEKTLKSKPMSTEEKLKAKQRLKQQQKRSETLFQRLLQKTQHMRQ